MYCPDCHAILSSDYECPRCGFSLRRGGAGGSKLVEGQEPPKATIDLTRRRSKQAPKSDDGKKLGELCIGDFKVGESIDDDTLRHYAWLGAKSVLSQDSKMRSNGTEEQFRNCFGEMLNSLRILIVENFTQEGNKLREMIVTHGNQPSEEQLRREVEASSEAVRAGADANQQVLHMALFFWVNYMDGGKASDIAKELRIFDNYAADIERKTYGPCTVLMACTLWAIDYQGYRKSVQALCGNLGN